MAQGLFFVFGVFVLLGLSLWNGKAREIDSRILAVIILYSLVSAFIHSFQFSLNSTYAAGFINFCLMSEGFMFVLCGCLLYWLVACHSRRFNIFYPVLAINVLSLFFALTQKLGIYLIWTTIMQTSGMGSKIENIAGLLGTKSQLAVFSAISIPILWHFFKPSAIIPVVSLFLSNSFTAPLALLISVSVFLLIKRDWKKLLLIFAVSAVVACFHVKWQKFLVRPQCWAYTVNEIIQSPLIGHGFGNTLLGNKIYLKNENYDGYLYRHNDYLNIARDLGLPFLVLIGIFIVRFFQRAKVDYMWVAIVTAMIACFFQTSFYYPRIAGIVIILAALKEIQCATGRRSVLV